MYATGVAGEPIPSRPVLCVARDSGLTSGRAAPGSAGSGMMSVVNDDAERQHVGSIRWAMKNGIIDEYAITEEARQTAEAGLTESVRRRICEERAEEVLRAVDNGSHQLSDVSLHYALMLWVGTKNYYRKRVNPAGQDFVRSVSLGVVAQHTGQVCLSSWAKEFPSLTKLLNAYARMHCRDDFEWSTITVNDGFASARHRDSGNEGHSFIKSVGDYEGGSLYVWPDDHSGKVLKSLSYGEAKITDPRAGVYFDGNQAHETQEFSGWRVSIVWLVAKCLKNADQGVHELIADLGFRVRSGGNTDGDAHDCQGEQSCEDHDGASNAGAGDGYVFTNIKVTRVGYVMENDLEGRHAMFNVTNLKVHDDEGPMRIRKVTFDDSVYDTETRHHRRTGLGKALNLEEVSTVSSAISVCQALMCANDLAFFSGHAQPLEIMIAWEMGALLFKTGQAEVEEDSDAFLAERQGNPIVISYLGKVWSVA